MHAFLYKGNKSKLFSDDAEYESALADGWTDAPVIVQEESKADVTVNMDPAKATAPCSSESKPVQKETKFKKINIHP